MEQCIFCNIVAGKIPSYKVFENDLFFGFLDIFPRSKGHTLIIPKKHYRWVYDVPEFDKFWLAAFTVTKAVQKSLKPKFVTYMTVGLIAHHAHIHIIPRWEDSESLPDTKKMASEELKTIAEKIKKAL